jgi:hypothetical protein
LKFLLFVFFFFFPLEVRCFVPLTPPLPTYVPSKVHPYHLCIFNTCMSNN